MWDRAVTNRQQSVPVKYPFPLFACTKPACQIHYPLLLLCVPIPQNQPLVSSQVIWWSENDVTFIVTQGNYGVRSFTRDLVLEWFILASPPLLSGWLRLIFLKKRIPKEKQGCVEMRFQVVCVCLITQGLSQQVVVSELVLWIVWLLHGRWLTTTYFTKHALFFIFCFSYACAVASHLGPQILKLLYGFNFVHANLYSVKCAILHSNLAIWVMLIALCLYLSITGVLSAQNCNPTCSTVLQKTTQTPYHIFKSYNLVLGTHRSVKLKYEIFTDLMSTNRHFRKSKSIAP